MMDDEEIRLALGIDPKGMCLRHPNVQVVTADSSEDGYPAFQACKVCRSELAAGGLKLQRKSMAYSIQAVKELHQDKRRWDNFKQNWKDQNSSEDVDNDQELGDDSGGAETDDIQAITKVTSGQASDADVAAGETKLPKNLNEIIRDALLRGSQVQRWLLVEKTYEIDSLKKQLESANTENEMLQKEMNNQKALFEETIRRQEKTINQELKMIKSIASQRAVSRATKPSHSSEGEPGMHRSISTIMQSSTASLSLSVSSHEAPPQLPIRQASEKGAATSSHSLPVEKQLSIVSGPKDPPKLPIRQTSSQLKPMMKSLSKPKVSPRSVQRKISGGSNSNPPSCPQRQASEEVSFDAPVDQNSVSQNSADTKTSGVINSIHANHSDIPNPTSNGSIPSFKEAKPSGETTRDSQNNESSGSQEISFVPTDSERIVRTTSITEAAGNLHKGSQEIEFDASAAFQGPKDLLRKTSANMKFDNKQQLLLEASQALGNVPTPSQRHRKTSSKESTTDGSSETPKEIKFDRPGIIPLERKMPRDAAPNSENETTDQQLLQSIIFGKAAVASAEDEEDDDYDDFGLPSELPVNSERYLDCTRDTMNLSPVSALTSASCMFDAGLGTGADEEVIEPRKALQNAPFAKRLPMEENFDSDDDTKPEKPDKLIIVPKKTPHVTASAFHKPTPKRVTKKVMRVENQVVHDKYGDGGMYSGYVSLKDRLPHGSGKMIYDNGREYEGDWKGGRWHGFGRWKNPNGDFYEGNFVYDARHGPGVYRWRNGNEYRGDFHEDKRQGQGIFNFANGNVYEGDFVNGIFEGKGRYKFEGGFYEGDWASGRYHGKGFLSFADGSSYRGGFENGVASGEGEETASNGLVRLGIWENGRPTT